MKTTAITLLRSAGALFPSSHYALLSLFFFIGLELLFIVHRWLPLLLFILLAILVFGIILIRSEEGDQFHPTQTILPTLAAFGFTAFAVYLPLTAFIHIYFFLCAGAFFFILKYGAKQAWPTWNSIISVAVLYAVVAPIIGWRFTLYTPVWMILLLVFPTIALMALQSLLRYTKTITDAGLIALIVAFILSELTWVLQFLPLHFVVQSGCIVAAYYGIIQITTMAYEQKITPKLLLEYGIVSILATSLLLLTARWS
jgi:hypothetical protein